MLRSLPRPSIAASARRRRAHAVGWLLLTAASSTFLACGGQSTLCQFRGTVNAPEHRTMRRQAMATGLGEFCRQMQERGTPISTVEGGPSTGRFFGTSCQQRSTDNGDLAVSFSGRGYAYMSLTKKVTFEMQGAVQYNQDFLVAQNRCDIYGYFRPRTVQPGQFNILFVEEPAAQFVNQMSNMGQQLGQQLVSDTLNKGFTVIMLEEGGNDFGLGIVELGQRPYQGLNVQRKGRSLYENGRTEIHSQQRDFIGAVRVSDKDSSIFITAQVDGGVAVDVMVMRKGEGDLSVRNYIEQAKVGPLAGTPVWSDVVQPGQTGFSRAVPLPPGLYYVVFDNSSVAGTVSPPGNLFDDRAALVDYSIQVGKSK